MLQLRPDMTINRVNFLSVTIIELNTHLWSLPLEVIECSLQGEGPQADGTVHLLALGTCHVMRARHRRQHGVSQGPGRHARRFLALHKLLAMALPPQRHRAPEDHREDTITSWVPYTILYLMIGSGLLGKFMFCGDFNSGFCSKTALGIYYINYRGIWKMTLSIIHIA